MKPLSRMRKAAANLRDQGRRIADDRRGNVAMMFALTLPVMLMMTAAGVDIHRLSTVQSNLQDALDAATLAAARSPRTDDEGISEFGMAALRANLVPYPDIRLLEDSVTFHLNDQGAVVADADVNVSTLLANIVLPPHGRILDDSTTVRAHSEVMRSNYRIEVALVIDNTGSMSSSGKLRAAQTAATNLVNRLAAAADRSVEQEAVRISLVPFSMTVRPMSGFTARQSNTSAAAHTWLDRSINHTGSTGTQGLFATGQNRFALFDNLRTGWAGCIESRPYPHDVTDTAPVSSNSATMFVPYFSPDSPDRNDYPNDSTWRNWTYENDYVNDVQAGSSSSFSNATTRNNQFNTRLRDAGKYTNASILSGVTLNASRGPNQGCDMEPVTRLTEDYAAINASISRMVATGTTNIPMGLMWGWHTLSPNAPFSDGRPYGEERLQKIIILLTDGDNVNNTASNPNNSEYTGVGLMWQNRLGVGSSSSGTQRRDAMDARLAELCTNLRNREVMLYTVGVGVSSRTQELLRNCATENDMFYNVTSTNGIEAAFDRIAGAIENLRISK